MTAARTIPLHDGWQLARTPAGECTSPAGLAAAKAAWRDAVVPGTVACALDVNLDAPPDIDFDDWWYRTTFTLSPGRGSDISPSLAPQHWGGRGPGGGSRLVLRFEGLATLAEVWLNGEKILDSRNMFRARRVDVTQRLRDVNHLAIRFPSLAAALHARRPRPRWRTQLVEPQNLRWFRTTLLGRMSGWNPLVAPVGPWRPITLEVHEKVEVCAIDLQARAEEGGGRVRLRAEVEIFGGRLDDARLRVGEHEVPVAIEGDWLRADALVPDVPLWWPHTHGTPALLPCALELQVDGRWRSIDCGPVGFRAVTVDESGGGARLQVNGVPVFCRGAVWTTMDIRRLAGDPAELRRTLTLARDAGLNMLRVGGTMAYESDAFYTLCDELGILVWQDFMFANMDYPLEDPDFRMECEAEVRHQLLRLQRHACVAAYCGGSETAQQAAMLGLPSEQWTHPFFTDALPRRIADLHAGTPYFPATPWGGALPFHVGTGIAHYYGVGAYLRPLADARTANVRFATECLGFANVPEPGAAAKVTGNPAPPPHHPKWKARVPRDNGAGWDFEDTRDHYLRELFGVDPVTLRSRDLERYHALSRVVTGEVMRRTFAEWRRPQSECGGALVWTFRDLWPGAGWGVTDSDGMPKPAFWHLKRAWQPRAVHLTDEGLDGLGLHVTNDRPEPLEARVELVMLREGRTPVGNASATLRVAARTTLGASVDALLGRFTDATHAYNFGPPKQDVVAARLVLPDGTVLSEDAFFPSGYGRPEQSSAGVRTKVEALAGGRVAVTLTSDAFLQSVAVTSPYTPDDNYFHLVPGWEKRVVFSGTGEFRADFDALNRAGTIAVRGVQQAAVESDASANPGNADRRRWDADRRR